MGIVLSPRSSVITFEDISTGNRVVGGATRQPIAGNPSIMVPHVKNSSAVMAVVETDELLDARMDFLVTTVT